MGAFVVAAEDYDASGAGGSHFTKGDLLAVVHVPNSAKNRQRPEIAIQERPEWQKPGACRPVQSCVGLVRFLDLESEVNVHHRSGIISHLDDHLVCRSSGGIKQ